MRLFLLLALVLLAGCETTGGTKPDLPGATRAEHTVTTRQVYVPISNNLTAPCPIEPAGAASDAERVAAARKASLSDCNSRMAQIRAIQGTPVKAGD